MVQFTIFWLASLPLPIASADLLRFRSDPLASIAPTLDPVLEPIFEPILERVLDPIPERIHDPILEPVLEPRFEPIRCVLSAPTSIRSRVRALPDLDRIPRPRPVSMRFYTFCWFCQQK